MEDEDTKSRTIWCGNLSNRVNDEIIYELFLQAGPIEDISLPKDKYGVNRGYAFITYKHQCTVKYAIQLFEGTSLYDRKLRITPRGGGSTRKSEPMLTNPFMMNGSTNDNLNQQYLNNSQEDFSRFKASPSDFPRSIVSPSDFSRSKASPRDFSRSTAFSNDFTSMAAPRSLMDVPYMSPIPLSEASLRGQWSHSSPFQQSPPKNHKHDSNKRYQDRYQSNYYDRKRDNRNRKRRK